MDWESQQPIESRESSDHNGQWVPAIEVYQNDVDADGNAAQKFILHDGSADGRYPVDYVGQALDLNDPQVLIDQWKTLNKRPDDGAGD